MISEKKRAANRENGRKSKGPKTAAGKSHSRLNAWRHGLAGITRDHAAYSNEIKNLADAICKYPGDCLMYEQALIIAEADVVLRCVRGEMIACIERLRDPVKRPLRQSDDRITRAKAASEKYRILYKRQLTANARYFALTEEEKDALEERSEPSELAVTPPAPPPPRDECEAMRLARPDLRVLARYERRAWSRRRKAVRSLIELHAESPWRRDWSKELNSY